MTTRTVTRQQTRTQTQERATKKQNTNTQKKTRSVQNHRAQTGSNDPSSSDPSSRSRTPSYGSKRASSEEKSSDEVCRVEYVDQLEVHATDLLRTSPLDGVDARVQVKDRNKHKLTIQTTARDRGRAISIKTPSTGISPKTVVTRYTRRLQSRPGNAPSARSISTTNPDAARHPSLESLRQARLHHLEQEMNRSALDTGAHVLQAHHSAPYMNKHAESGKRAVHDLSIRPTKRGAPGGDSNPDVSSLLKHDNKRRKLPPNIHFRLANIAPHEIAHLQHQGYVVDALPAVFVENLPLSAESRDRLRSYQNSGWQGIITGIGTYERYIPSEASESLNWAYVSKLPISEIGADGRRRTLLSRHGIEEKEEHWVVALIPMNEAQLDDLRMHMALYQQYHDAA